MRDQANRISRRAVIKTTGVAAAAGLAGCGGDGGSGELEIVHWWTAGGEQEAIKALILTRVFILHV